MKNQQPKLTAVKQELLHPVRIRLMSLMRDGEERTQREMGRFLSMSSAAIHYHLKGLLDCGLMRLSRTRPGPNGITEKMYAVNREAWETLMQAPAEPGDLAFYLDYTTAWMHERHREGVELIKAGQPAVPFLIGSYTVHATPKDIAQLKHELEKCIQSFFERHEEIAKDSAHETCSVTVSLMPSHARETRESRAFLDYEPLP